MSESGQKSSPGWWKISSWQWTALLQEREEQVFLVLTLVIGALVGLVVVAFILLTERSSMRLYPAGGAAWRRLLVPMVGSLGTGYLLFRYFPDARGSGVPQTKAALYAREGRITLGTVFGKFFCTTRTRRAGCTGWCGDCIRSGPLAGPACRKSEGAPAGGGGRGNRCGV
jgi:CIC family chloride channel protein